MRRELLQQALAGLVAGGQQLRHDAEGTDLGRGGLADAGNLDAGERARIQPELGELLPDRTHRVGRGEHHPLVAAVDQALDRALHLRGAARRLDRDRRHLVRDGAVRPKPVAHHTGLLLGARHQDFPAVQRAGLPPGQLAALGHDVADGHHQVALQLTGVGGERGQRRVDGALLDRGTGSGHRDRGRRRPAVLDQSRRGLGEVAAGGVQHQRTGHRGQRSPVHVAADVHLGVHGAERDTGIGRNRAAAGDAGDDVERGTGLGDLLHLADHGVGGQRVTGDQPHHGAAGRGLVRQVLGHVRRVAHGGANLGAVGGLGDDVGGYVRVGHQQRGAGDHIPAPNGEQSRVTGTGAHESNPSGGLTCSGHQGTPHQLLPGPLSNAALASSNWAANSRPSRSAAVVSPVMEARTN